MEVQGVKIEFLGHAGFVLANGSGRRIALDPYNVSEKVEKVDSVLLTHSHYDHCSIRDITQLVKPGAAIIAPADVASKITKVEGVQMQMIEVGDELSLGGVKVEAVAAYNVNKKFHPKSEGWLGYVVKFDGVVVYHAGDSDKIPEMSKLTGYAKHGNVFVALLPVSGTYVMTAEEAAEVASALHVDIAIPMHYGAGVAGTLEDAQRFVKLCDSVNVHAEILEKT